MSDKTDQERPLEEIRIVSRKGNDTGRISMKHWEAMIRENVYTQNADFEHSIRFYFGDQAEAIHQSLVQFGKIVSLKLEPLVAENDYRFNHPRLENYSGIGERTNAIVHHPAYVAAGKLIYGTGLMAKLSQAGKMLESLCQFFISSHAGEAGHNCPVACTGGVIRVLQKYPDLPNRSYYMEKLLDPNFESNFIGAQFVTEVQGGSDVGLNDVVARPESDGTWKIHGEKWFCSSADADIILMTARFDPSISGTKGLGLYLVPRILENGLHNNYLFRRLKEKIGTRTMATAEADFFGATAYAVGSVENGFKILMENVLHLSRLYNTFAALGAASRAYQIALAYVKNRVAFKTPAINYPLVRENLARIKTENTAVMASIMATVQLQDRFDTGRTDSPRTALHLRLLANLNKYISALWSVDHVHHALDMLAGNGTIETFSAMPRLLRDVFVFENWEGTHNTLRMQILRDIHKYQIDEIFLEDIDRKLINLQTRKEFLEPLVTQTARLKEKLAVLKTAPEEIQSLQIRFIVDEMAIVFCGLNLLIEGLHQEEVGQSTSKLNMLLFFYRLHFESDKALELPDYVRLINQIMAV